MYYNNILLISADESLENINRTIMKTKSIYIHVFDADSQWQKKIIYARFILIVTMLYLSIYDKESILY